VAGFIFAVVSWPRLVPVKIRPDIGAALAAGRVRRTDLQCRSPLIAVDRDRLAAVIVGAIDQQTAHAHLAHLAERDLLRALHHRDQSTAAARFIANRGRLVARSVGIVPAAWCVISPGSGSATYGSTSCHSATIIASTIVGSTVDATAIYTGLKNGNSAGRICGGVI